MLIFSNEQSHFLYDNRSFSRHKVYRWSVCQHIGSHEENLSMGQFVIVIVKMIKIQINVTLKKHYFIPFK